MLRVGFVLLFGWVLTAKLGAQPLPEAAPALAARISSLPQHPPIVSLEFQDLTAQPAVEWSSFRSAFEVELRKAGVEIATTQPETRLKVTMSENPRGLLFVAEVITKESREIAMLPWNAPPASQPKPQVKLVKQPLIAQAEPILDVALDASRSELLVLSPSRVTSYQRAGDKWTLVGQASVTLARPLPRDERARLEVTSATLQAYLPGTTCSGTLQPTLRIACAPAGEPWPLNPRDAAFAVRWVPDRNLLESASMRAPFYSAAADVFASADGRIEARDSEPVAGAADWGSDIASIENSCGTGPLAIASSRSDTADQLQAYQTMNGRATPASDALPLPGAVTALWPAETAGQVTLVVRNSKTGEYEASRLGLACTQ